MPISSERWKQITPSQFPWEREALDFVRERLPDADPYRAWSNFEFIADDGTINEVDLLVLTPRGFFLVEIKSKPGALSGDRATWIWSHDGRSYTEDNPIILANRKAKKLASLLKRQKACQKIRVPYLDPLVFCSFENLDCRLHGVDRYRICLRDQEKTVDRPAAPGIIAALKFRNAEGLFDNFEVLIDRPVGAIAGCRMRMKLTADVLQRHQNGQRIFASALHFIVISSEFWLNKGEAELPVQSGLSREGTIQSQHLHGAGNGSQFSQMGFGPRTRDQSQTPIMLAGNLDLQQNS